MTRRERKKASLTGSERQKGGRHNEKNQAVVSQSLGSREKVGAVLV